MAKTEKSYDYLVRLMTDAGTYDPRYEAQIESTAWTLDMIKKIRKKIGNDLVSDELKTAGVDTKKVANPLLDTLNKFQKLYQGQLAALGLNYDGYKKPTNKKAENSGTDEDDPTMAYFNSING